MAEATNISSWYEKGYLGEKLAISALHETLSNLIEYSTNNIEKGLDYYKTYRGEGLDFRLRIKGYKYSICGEVKNINHENYLTTGWFMKEHELRFPSLKKGGDKYILIITAKISGETKKWLNSKGIEVWKLPEQINKDNFERMKQILITKYIRPLLFCIKSILTKYSNPSIVYSIVQDINNKIRYTYIDNIKIDRTKLIELNEKGLKVSKWTEARRLKAETDRLHAKFLEEQAHGFSAVRLPNGCLVWK